MNAVALSDRAINSLARSLSRVTPLTWYVGASQRFAIRAELALRSSALSTADGPAVHWHEGGTGPAVLLLNGVSASGLLWPSAFVTELERHHRVIRIDNRGTGWSCGAPSPFTIARMADDALEVLQACGEESAVVVGLSMGGAIAQELALRHPGVVDRLVLMATIPPPPSQVPPPDVARLMRVLLGPLTPGRAGDAAHRARAAHAVLALAGRSFVADPDLREEIGHQLLAKATPRWGALQQSRAVVAWHGPQRLRGIRAHTVVLTGAEDPVIPVANGERIAALVPGAEHVVLPGVGHLVPWEAPDAVLDAIRGRRHPR